MADEEVLVEINGGDAGPVDDTPPAPVEVTPPVEVTKRSSVVKDSPPPTAPKPNRRSVCKYTDLYVTEWSTVFPQIETPSLIEPPPHISAKIYK